MYRQIRVHRDDADYQRIVWRSSPNDALKDYQLLTVTYGTAPAPFLSLCAVQQLKVDEGDRFPLAIPILEDQAYIDDYIFGAHDKETAIQTRDQTIELLRCGGLHLRKWASNKQELLEGLDPTDHGLASRDLGGDNTLKVLGIIWYPDCDEFQFKVDVKDNVSVAQPLTKRTLLSIIARIYDPLGWIAPVVVSAKIFMQQLWLVDCGWDDVLPIERRSEWHSYHSQLSLLYSIRIPRWISCRDNKTPVQLHGFADASTKTYAAVVYIRVERSNKSAGPALLIAKSKVAPIKTISAPRLELCAALLLSQLLSYTRNALQLPTTCCYGWSDSDVTLQWIKQSPSKWETFVANRVSKIQTIGADVIWRHVPTGSNPADCASRGISPQELLSHKTWWFGPPWLTAPETSWPVLYHPSEEKSHYISIQHDTVEKKWDLATRFSTWRRLIRVTAFIYQFIQKVRTRSSSGTSYQKEKVNISLLPLNIHKAGLNKFKPTPFQMISVH